MDADPFTVADTSLNVWRSGVARGRIPYAGLMAPSKEVSYSVSSDSPLAAKLWPSATVALSIAVGVSIRDTELR